MNGLFHPTQNHLLAALSEEVRMRLVPHLEHHMMAPGRVVVRAGEALQYVYFPTTAVLSIHCLLENGATSELAIVGAEGLLGIELFLGGSTTPNHALVQTGGHAFRLPTSWFLKESAQAGGALQKLLLLYAQTLMTQMSQMAVCNCHHSTEQRLSRWLLELSDRTHSAQMHATQESLGSLLGVRREAVTDAASHLQALMLIEYRRGQLRILDRAGLEGRACECYDVLRREAGRLLRRPAPARLAHAHEDSVCA